MKKIFHQRKKDILSKDDKSSIGSWDDRIKSLCDKINSSNDYYTTSSCSGRIMIIKDEDKKAPGLFEFVSHGKVGVNEIKKVISSLIARIGSSKQTSSSFSHNKSVKMKNLAEPILNKGGVQLACRDFKFKQEPPILHVACFDIKKAEELLKKAQEAGWKRSGIISLGNNIIVELISTEKLEFPLVEDGKLLVDNAFLKIVLEKANENLQRGWDKIEKLRKLL